MRTKFSKFGQQSFAKCYSYQLSRRNSQVEGKCKRMCSHTYCPALVDYQQPLSTTDHETNPPSAIWLKHIVAQQKHRKTYIPLAW